MFFVFMIPVVRYLEKRAQLDAMGFERSRVEAAIQACKYDVDKAINRLVSES